MSDPPTTERRLYRTFVAYVDALGTSAATGDAEVSDGFLVALESIFEELEQSLHADRALRKLEFQVFSDLMCIAAPRNSREPLHDVVRSVATVLRAFAAYGIFVRGGIAYDDFFSGRNLVYGPAIVKAVKIEQTTSLPRVALAPETAEIALEFLAGDPDAIPVAIDESDRTLFVDFVPRLDPREKFLFRGHLEKWSSTASGSDSHRKKADWMAAYYNWRSNTKRPLSTNHAGGFSREFWNFRGQDFAS